MNSAASIANEAEPTTTAAMDTQEVLGEATPGEGAWSARYRGVAVATRSSGSRAAHQKALEGRSGRQIPPAARVERVGE